MERINAAIIGSGPAGLSAGITLRNRNKTVAVFAKEAISSKVNGDHVIRNYLGIPNVAGSELAERFSAHAREMGVAFQNEQITAVYAMGSYFALQGKSGEMYEAESVILAAGVRFEKLLEGEEAFLGRGVSYCATCDAMLYKGKKVAVIASSPEEEREAAFLAEVAGETVYIPLYDMPGDTLQGVKILRVKPQAFAGGFKAEKLITDGGEIAADGFFVLRSSVAPAQLVPGLQMDGNHIAVDREMKTNLPGCFACGDITGLPYQYMKAAGEGNIAAISAARYLDSRK